MKTVTLRQCGELHISDETAMPGSSPSRQSMRVLYCGVCRTDAKMWQTGHRDLKLPRDLGHEIAAINESTGKLYTVWPGQVCGNCKYCRMGRENLCEEMQIIGFHSNGGFGEYISVPHESLIEVERDINPRYLSFAEPIACAINGLSRCAEDAGIRAIIYGGGILGILAALLMRERGWQVTVIERSEEKIARLLTLATENNISLSKDTVEADFDVAMNCCDSPAAFSLCITKVRKGGQFLYFSGLTKNEELETNLLNLIHYKELEVFGFYGPRKEHMVDAVSFCIAHYKKLDHLIERMVDPEDVEAILPRVLSGESLKYILSFPKGASGDDLMQKETPGALCPDKPGPGSIDSTFLKHVIASIPSIPDRIKLAAQKKVDLKTKPLGALGRIESLAVQMSCIQGSLMPEVTSKRMFVFAGDHGVVEEGVSAFPQKVTAQMVENFLDGGAAINTFCHQYGIELSIVDMGVAGEFGDHPLLINSKVARGTRNFTLTTAMSNEQAIQAIEAGAKIFLSKSRMVQCDLVGLGEMGIGNTTSASAIICAATGLAPDVIVGRGTGVDDRGLQRKKEVIEKALDLHQATGKDGIELLMAFGGFELAGICGAILAAASQRCCVVLDGFISTAAGLVAFLIQPEIRPYLVAGHQSVETGQTAALELMGIEPVVDLGLRLGEGTGSAITMNLVELSCNMMRKMASFEDAGVDNGSTISGESSIV